GRRQERVLAACHSHAECHCRLGGDRRNREAYLSPCPIVQAIGEPNSSCSHMIRSHARQRTTPWIAAIGPSSTIRARKALCIALSLGGIPGEGILMSPSAPCSLNRITQSRSV